jgi:hypothetical protein
LRVGLQKRSLGAGSLSDQALTSWAHARQAGTGTAQAS